MLIELDCSVLLREYRERTNPTLFCFLVELCAMCRTTHYSTLLEIWSLNILNSGYIFSCRSNVELERNSSLFFFCCKILHDLVLEDPHSSWMMVPSICIAFTKLLHSISRSNLATKCILSEWNCHVQLLQSTPFRLQNLNIRPSRCWI